MTNIKSHFVLPIDPLYLPLAFDNKMNVFGDHQIKPCEHFDVNNYKKNMFETFIHAKKMKNNKWLFVL